MIELLKQLDIDLFLKINEANHPLFDYIMYWVSETYFWLPVYALLCFMMFYFYGKKAFLLLLLTAVLIFFSDSGSVHLFKETFHRLRPCHNPDLQGLVHLVNNHCGGKYGFVSSHAANHFAVAGFIFVLFRKNVPFIGISLFLWAALVGYSRIYLGVHYPADVFFGAIYGVLLGLLIGEMALRIVRE